MGDADARQTADLAGEVGRSEEDDGQSGVDNHFVLPGIHRCQDVEASAGAQEGEGFQDVSGDFLEVAIDGVDVEQGEIGAEGHPGEDAAEHGGAEGGQPEAADVAEQMPVGGHEREGGEGQDEEQKNGLIEFAGGLQPPGEGHAAGVADGGALEIAGQEKEKQGKAEAQLHIEFDHIADPVGQDGEEQCAEESGAACGAEGQQPHPKTNARQCPEEKHDEVIDGDWIEADGQQGGGNERLGPVERLKEERARIGVIHVGVAVGRHPVAGEDGARDQLQFPGVKGRVPVLDKCCRDVLLPRPGDGDDGEHQEQEDERCVSPGNRREGRGRRWSGGWWGAAHIFSVVRSSSFSFNVKSQLNLSY